MSLTFEWDENKASENLSKHAVSFPEAVTVFEDSVSRTIPDPLRSSEEDRFVIAGVSELQRTLVVVHTYRENVVRISARVKRRHVREMTMKKEQTEEVAKMLDEYDFSQGVRGNTPRGRTSPDPTPTWRRSFPIPTPSTRRFAR
jgi:uncharacterized DUF497 family protein